MATAIILNLNINLAEKSVTILIILSRKHVVYFKMTLKE